VVSPDDERLLVTEIHPFAVVSPQADLGRDVSLGPFCVVEDGVKIGDRCRLAAHAVVKSGTTLGCDNQVCESAVLGGAPQHLRAGETLGDVRIGDGNTIRESVTIHRGLAEGEMTAVGDQNLLMVNAHVGHDCNVGNHTIIANNVMLAGHVTVGDRAYLSGAVGVHQFCRVGAQTMVGGQARVTQDIPPFVMIDGECTKVVGLNLVGLRRSGFTQDQIIQLKAAYQVIYRSDLAWSDVLARLREEFPDGPVTELARFLSTGERGFVQERRRPRSATVKLRVHNEEDEAPIPMRKAG